VVLALGVVARREELDVVGRRHRTFAAAYIEHAVTPLLDTSSVTSKGTIPILYPMQTADPYPGAPAPRRPPAALWGLGERLTWLSGLVLLLSTLMGWYVGSGEGPTLSVIGWHAGVLGKLVFFVALAVLALVALRQAGIELPATVPESLVVIALGALATVFVLIRLISIPEEYLPAQGRGVGIWISLLAALGVIAAGLLEAAEEL
jgi:hypothetical protein